MTIERLFYFIKKDFIVRNIYINGEFKNDLDNTILKKEFYNWEHKRVDEFGKIDVFINLDEETALRGYK